MNNETQIVEIALENLKKNAGITGKWKEPGIKDLDGKLELKLNNKTIKLNAEIKKELRVQQLPQLFAMAKRFEPLIIVALHIFTKIKDELRKKEIAYLEANGNIYLKQEEIILWLDVQKPLATPVDKTTRAFTKTGLKVIFYFLLNDRFINLPYREIASLTGVALGNINYVVTGLKEHGFLLKLNKNEHKLNNRKELLEKWMAAYAERLKPTLKIGTFRFLKEEYFNNWKKIPLKNGKTWWGGEPASDLLTNYLKPAELTLYTLETRTDLIKNYRLVPDDKGNVKVFKKFWQDDKLNNTADLLKGTVVPLLLVYADLMNTNDKRCIETAQKLYEQYLQDKFQ